MAAIWTDPDCDQLLAAIAKPRQASILAGLILRVT
jgi:hypothetical protein